MTVAPAIYSASVARSVVAFLLHIATPEFTIGWSCHA